MSSSPSSTSRQVAWTWTLFLLGVVCLPRATIDIYLPSLPAIARELGASSYELQLTMTVYMVGYAISMLVCGPLADRFGRRTVLIGGIGLYFAASVVCTVASTATGLITGRFLQALGGCCGTVVGRVIVRDRYPPHLQTGVLSTLSTGMALSPVIAPLIGGIVEVGMGWRWTFVLLTVSSAALLLALDAWIPETLPAGSRPLGLRDLARLYRKLLCTREFLRYALTISLAYCTYFPFVMDSSNIFQRGMNWSPIEFAIAYGTTVLGYLLGTTIFRRRAGALGADALIGWAIRLNVACAITMKFWAICSPASAFALLVPMAVLMLTVGMIIPACQFAVLQPYPHVAGAASGLFFFVQMGITAACSWILAQLADGTSSPMASITLTASLLTAWAWRRLQAPGSPTLDRA
ncbi:multidrug effflux MFS transporter [Roseateles flavus]|uniref:Bcr/CflA family efflux transporter n=1 Tax=Roseateles flavus TaxID=3149041 RepID=A0ABV0GGC9_9BURK